MTDTVAATAEELLLNDIATPDYYQIEATAAPFTNDENGVLINGKYIVQHIGNTSIINTKVRASLNIDQAEGFDNILFELMSSNRSIMRLADMSELYNGAAQFDKLVAATDDIPFERVRDLGLRFTDQDVSVIARFNELKASTIKFFADLKPVVKYQFVEKPHSVNAMTISGTGKNVRVTNRGGYRMGPAMARRLWDAANAVWSGEAGARNSVSVRTDYSRTAYIYTNHVEIGCQTITRWEIEQAAVDLGFTTR